MYLSNWLKNLSAKLSFMTFQLMAFYFISATSQVIFSFIFIIRKAKALVVPLVAEYMIP